MKAFIVPVLCILALAGSGSAQVKVIEANGLGTATTVSLAASDNALKELQFYYISRGAVSLPVAVGLEGPFGLSGTLEARVLKGTIGDALSDASGWYEVKLNLPLVTKAVAASFEASSDECGWLTPELYQELLRKFQADGQNPTREQVCEYYTGGQDSGGDNQDPPPGTGIDLPGSGGQTQDGSGAVAAGFLRKDTCNSKKNSRYLVRLRVSLAGVDPNLFAGGFTVSAQILERAHRGKMAATIKPVSDGRFAPRPLVLMSSTAGYGSDESIEVFRWNKGKPKLMRQLRVEDYVYYRGFTLARALADTVLKGGRATFEINNGRDIYSVCFQLARRRQTVNGYPK